MSDNIYEIAQLMRNEDNFNAEMAEAMELVKNHFQHKYMKRLNRVVQAHQQKVKEHPPREAHLLQALKPFMNEASHKSIDRTIEMLMMLHSTQSIHRELNSYSAASLEPKTSHVADQRTDTTIHEDGVYDLDSVCLAGKKKDSLLPGLLMLMAMCSK